MKKRRKTIAPKAGELKEYMVLSAYNMGITKIIDIMKKTGLTRYFVKKVLEDNGVVIENPRAAIGYLVNILEENKRSYRHKFYSENALIEHIQKFSTLSESGIRSRLRKALDQKRSVLFHNDALLIRFIDHIDKDEVEKYWEKKRAEFNPYKK